jgi:hypothetical protein
MTFLQRIILAVSALLFAGMLVLHVVSFRKCILAGFGTPQRDWFAVCCHNGELMLLKTHEPALTIYATPLFPERWFFGALRLSPDFGETIAGQMEGTCKRHLRFAGFALHRDATPTVPIGRPLMIEAPLWLPSLLVAWPMMTALFRFQRRRRRIAGGLCGECGYDLRFASNRCPECGEKTTSENRTSEYQW